ncbi:MAG: RnfABCDGE type electron transport complex subunit C [Oscillospiraceae bacterium]|nr:RnfABCDGE type electron transport complex subunit C [Oscillospiraceae bacterium]
MILNAVKLPEYKDSAEKKTETPPLPAKVIISLSQNIGAPCEPLVKIGDNVLTGQMIGDSNALISVPVHSSVTGTVEDEVKILSVDGRVSRALVIKTAPLNKMHESIKPPEITDKASFLKAVRNSGSVGLGGAGFPTYVKLSFDKSKTPVNTLIINAAECEPFVTGDYREIMENSRNVFEGIELVMKHLEIPKAVIGIEKDKPKAIALLSDIIKEKNADGITIKPLPLKYPQGAEKILIYQTTGKTIKEGELPLHSGCLVLNVSTVSFLAEYMKTGVPLITRRLTIDGDIVNNAKNIFVPVGTPLEELIKSANLRKTPDRIVFGGPMMGFSAYDMQTPVTKTTGAVLFFGEFNKTTESACIRCGKCIHVCSMNLSPYELNTAYDANNIPLLRRLKVNLCMSCSACSFVCPAKRNICEKNQLAKQLLKENKS